VYGYEAEDRHFCRVFLGLEQPKLTFADGLDVVKLLMTAYQSAEQGRTVDYPGEDLDTFTSAVSRYEWKR
jgi:predicted dehydrogenase